MTSVAKLKSLSDKAAVTGVGETVYARETDKNPLTLCLEASLNAIRDAGLDPKEIDGVIPYGIGGVVAEDFVTNFGLPDLSYSALIPMGGASAVAALQTAAMAVATGVANHVLLTIGRGSLAAGGRITNRLSEMPQMKVVGEFEMPHGSNAPAQFYAHMARRHMEMYGTTSEQLAEVALTCRANAVLNENIKEFAQIILNGLLHTEPCRSLDIIANFGQFLLCHTTLLPGSIQRVNKQRNCADNARAFDGFRRNIEQIGFFH